MTGPNGNPNTILVIGGGVAGMRAAADLAETGLKVILVEASPSLGGRVAQLGFMFPTHDCVLCRGSTDHGYGCTRPSISPAFPDNNRHPNIRVETLTEVTEVTGQAGDFTVTLRHHPRHVDVDRCVNCRLCTVVCPVNLPSEFQMGMAFRKAAYKTAPRAIPDAYVIETGPYCEDCGKCAQVCPTQCIDLNQQASTERVHVGSIILAVGYKPYDPTPLEEYGYGRYQNVVTPMHYERLASRSGPTEGIVARISDGKLPKKIAWLQCIGSRDQEHPYCSSICCMFATKEAILAKQRIGEEIDCTIFVMDERAFNKEYTKYYNLARDKHGVNYERCRVSAIREDPSTKDLIVKYPGADGKLIEERFELVVLATGVEPPARSAQLASMLDIDLNAYGFCETDKFQPLQTSQPGVFVAGAFQSPKEIAETVFDAAGAAGEVMRVHHDGLGSCSVPREYPFLVEPGSLPPERDVSNEPLRIGVFVCHCGPVVSHTIDVDQLSQFSGSLPSVVSTHSVEYACFSDGLDQIRDTIIKDGLNRVVIAACSHRTHESMFQRVVREAGINPSYVEVANVREHCAWVHDRDPEGATRKAKELVRVAVHRASTAESVSKTAIVPHRRGLIVGGGVSGMTAAITLADSGFDVTLVEKSDSLGGNLRHVYFLAEGLNPQRLLRDLINRVRGHHRIQVITRGTVNKVSGSLGQFKSVIVQQSEFGELSNIDIEHGVVIIATGGVEGSTNQYLRSEDDRVITQLELEDWLIHDPEKIMRLNNLVMVQCVEAQEIGRFYCSRTCCTSTMKNAIRLKMMNPDCQVTVLYRDIITYGFREQYYTEARERGVVFVRYSEDNSPVVESLNGELQVTIEDPSLSNRQYQLPADLLCLSMPIVPSEGTERIADLFGVPLSDEGFYLEADLKMRPMDFVNEGIFMCGMAHYPRFIEESIASAQAAAGRAITILSQQPMFVGGIIAEVDPDLCVGCLTCVRTCPFTIPKIKFDRAGVGELGGYAWIDPALCQGCGTCTGECPATAINLVNFTDEQMLGDPSWLGSWLPDSTSEIHQTSELADLTPEMSD